MGSLNNRVLVLNKNWIAISTTDVAHAISLCFNEYKSGPYKGQVKAVVVDPQTYQMFSWDEWAEIDLTTDDEVIKSTRQMFKLPKVILLNHYDRLPAKSAKFSRRKVYKRDNYICQYCGKAIYDHEECTLDHVMPRSRGGETSWENTVLACEKCNFKKADRTPEEANMPLKRIPQRPKFATLVDGHCDDDWRNFVGN